MGVTEDNDEMPTMSMTPATAAPEPAGAQATPVDATGDSTDEFGHLPPAEFAAPEVDAAEQSSPLAVFDEDKPRRRGRRAFLVTLSLVVLLAGAYAGTCWAFAQRVPPGTTVAGVAVGGKSAAEAKAALETGLAGVAKDPIAVTAGDKSATIDPASAGLVLDSAATVDKLTGFTLRPAALWAQIFGAKAAAPVTHVDGTQLTAAVTAVADALATDPVDGSIAFVDGAPHATPPVPGDTVDVAKAATLLQTTWATGARPIALPVTSVAPTIGLAELDAAMTTSAAPLATAPVAVAVGGQVAQLPVSVLTGAASFVVEDKALVMHLDGAELVKAVVARTTNLLTTAADASFTFVNDAPSLVPGTAGTTIDPAGLATAVLAATTSTDRTARVERVPADSAQSTAALEKLGIKEIVSEFATTLTAEPVRTKNLVRGSEKINGTLVLPGETFSISKVLAPITEAGGYFPGHQIENGVFVTGIGGGLSQMATTTYNAAFFAGFEDVEHQPHSYYFSRYPEGREATIFQGQIDMKFKNNTPYGALLQAWVADNQVHVRVWSTKYWTVATTTSARSAVVNPTTVRSTAAGCQAQAAGSPGFKVTVTRTLSLDGVVKANESKSWRYKPQDTLTCG